MKRCALVVCCLVLGGVAGTFVAGPLLVGQAPAPPAIPRELTSYRDVVKKVLPAVVSIDSRAKAAAPGRRRRDPADEPPPDEFRRFFDDDGNGPPTPRGGFGSGFLVDARGVVLTNFHVVEGAAQVVVELRDGRKFTSRDIKTDPKTDLAIVRIQANGPLPFLELGDSSAMEIGDRVLAVGAPFGLTGTVTHGIVSATGRNLQLNMYEDFLQTDAAINPGNSGGPLVSLEGKVIGINSAIKSRSGGFQGVGMAIASNLAQNIMKQLLKDGVVRRGYLGVQIKDILDPEVAGRLGVKEGEHAVLVTRVFPDTPGARAGLKNGDVVTRLAGKAVRDSHELITVVASLPLGKPADVTVLRDGRPQTLQVTVEEQPAEYGTVRVPVPRGLERMPDSVAVDKVGLEGADLTADIAEALGYKEGTRGVLITKVDKEGVAAEGGLRPGAVVTKVDKKPVSSAKELREALAAAALDKGVLLQFETPQGGTNFSVLKAGGKARP
jgi:serine protease Do